MSSNLFGNGAFVSAFQSIAHSGAGTIFGQGGKTGNAKLMGALRVL